MRLQKRIAKTRRTSRFGGKLALALATLMTAVPFSTAFAATYAINGSDPADPATLGGAAVYGDFIVQADGTSQNDNTFAIGQTAWTDLEDYLIGARSSETMTGNRTVLYTGEAQAVYGANANGTGAQANDNHVTVMNYANNFVNWVVCGGWAGNGAAARNTATVYNGKMGAVIGGRGDDDVTNNTATAEGGTIVGLWTPDDVYYALIGGWSEYGTASGNTATVNGGELKANAFGGFSARKDVADNTITVNGGIVGGGVYGGYALRGTVTGNTAIVNGGTINGSVYGGNAGTTKGNTAIINGGTITGDVYGGGSGSSAEGNAVMVYGGTMASVYGGRARKAIGNTVEIRGGTITTDVIGGAAPEDAEARGNVVTIKGGTVGDVYAGKGSYIYENTVNVHSDVGGGVYAGWMVFYGGNIDNNTVNWYAGDIAGDLHVSAVHTANSTKNNILRVYGKDLHVGSIEGFGKIHFYLGMAGEQPVNGDTIVTVGGAANVFGRQVQVTGIRPGSLQKGDTVTLLQAAGSNGAPRFEETVEVKEGFSRKRTVYQAWDSATSTFTATLGDKKKGLLEETKSLTEASALSMAVVTSTVDAMMGEGMKNAKTATQVASETGTGKQFSPFAYLGTGKMRYKTGSHVDSKDIGMGIGFVKSVETERGTLTFGPAVSYGYATYDSYLDGGTHASGNAKALGISFFVKQERKDGLYVEGSLGAGKIKTTYESADLATSYDTDAPYYAAHVGVGKVNKLSDRLTLDAYAKYMYSHQNANEATLTSGETYRFDNISSHRIRLGARMENAYRAENSIYYGVAWEHEFGGDARATFDGDSTPSPSLKGSSALLELGWKAKASKTSNLNADLFVNGWLGKKEGISFGANLCWEL